MIEIFTKEILMKDTPELSITRRCDSGCIPLSCCKEEHIFCSKWVAPRVILVPTGVWDDFLYLNLLPT